MQNTTGIQITVNAGRPQLKQESCDEDAERFLI